MKCPRCGGSGKVPEPSTFGERLLAIRESRGLTRKEVELATGIGHATYWRLEMNGNIRVTLDLVTKLADYYKVTTDELLGRKKP